MILISFCPHSLSSCDLLCASLSGISHVYADRTTPHSWVISKLVPRKSRLHETLKFLLDHPRRCFIYLFPSHQTWFLLTILVFLKCVLALFLVGRVSESDSLILIAALTGSASWCSTSATPPSTPSPLASASLTGCFRPLPCVLPASAPSRCLHFPLP